MLSNFGLFDLGTPELIIILAILLLLFGSKKLPELSKSIGQSVNELKKGMGSSESNTNKEIEKDNEQTQGNES